MAATRSFLRHAAVTLCLASTLVLIVPTPADAGASHTNQTGKAGRRAPSATTHRKAAPAVSSAQRCPCQAQVSSSRARARRQLGLRAPVSAPRPGTARVMIRRLFHDGQPSWRQPGWDAAFARRMVFPRPSFPLQDRQPQLLDTWRIRLIDGDTFAYGAQRIRVRGIDTPEVSESGGFEATQRLDGLLHEGPVTIVPEALDKYGRTVADVYVNDQNVADVLKAEGYSKPGSR